MRSFLSRNKKLSYYKVDKREDVENNVLKELFLDSPNTINYLVTKEDEEVAIFSLLSANEPKNLKTEIYRAEFTEIFISNLYVLKEYRFIGIASEILTLIKNEKTNLFKNEKEIVFINSKELSDKYDVLSIEEIKFFILRNKLIEVQNQQRKVLNSSSYRTIGEPFKNGHLYSFEKLIIFENVE